MLLTLVRATEGAEKCVKRQSGSRASSAWSSPYRHRVSACRSPTPNPPPRYLFALDFKDHDLYVTTFTEDGILDVGNGEVVGREAIKAAVANMPGGRRHITNLVLRIDGDRATGRAAWMHTGKDAQGRMTIGGYGHYEDDLVKVNGEWLLAKRRIYNEGNEAWAAPPGNLAW